MYLILIQTIFCFQGCWYIKIAEVLFPLTHKVLFTDSHMSLMSLEIVFIIEMLSFLCLTVAVGIFVNCRVEKMPLSAVSAALDIEYLLVKEKSTFNAKKKGVVFDDGSHEPLISGDGDSESGGCCIWRLYFESGGESGGCILHTSFCMLHLQKTKN